jgi:hypothetical protein
MLGGLHPGGGSLPMSLSSTKFAAGAGIEAENARIIIVNEVNNGRHLSFGFR